jgi:hypothetical protein
MLARLTAPEQICKELFAALALDTSKNNTSDTKPPNTAGGSSPGSTTPGGSSAGSTTPGGTTAGGTTPAGTTGSGTPTGGGSDTTKSATNNTGTQQSPASQALDVIKTRQAAAQDLAKQLLTMLGTLLAAVSSFYFGSAAASSASDPQKVADAAKTISSINK